jgi:hypothetical protein
VNGLLSPDLKVLNETKYFSEFDLNEHSVLAALLIDSQDFCEDGSHFASLSRSDFAAGATLLQKFRHTERRQRRREFGILTPVEHIRKRRPRLRFGWDLQAGGGAESLGMKPTTIASRITTLG